jgi:LAO/AO transport system kinase
MLKKDPSKLARLLRSIENKDPSAEDVLKSLYLSTGKAHIIGITGFPGAGKSTIIDNLITNLRNRDENIAVLAVDPTSPFTGGSLLGDRIRMMRHSKDPGVFIKSIPNHGWYGGLSRVTSEMVDVFDAAGYGTIIVETVGVGQAEVDIANMVHTKVVVLIGGLGDYIQVLKAGILEIADIFVINKTDKFNPDDLKYNLESLVRSKKGWKAPVIETQATRDEGLDNLCESIYSHKKYLKDSGEFSLLFSSRYKKELKQVLQEKISDSIDSLLQADNDLGKLMEKQSSIDPYSAADKIIRKIFANKEQK